MNHRIAAALQRIARATAAIRIRAEEQAAELRHGSDIHDGEEATAVKLERIADTLEATLA